MHSISTTNGVAMLSTVSGFEGRSTPGSAGALVPETAPLAIYGLELRYLLTALLLEYGARTSLSTLVERIEAEGFGVPGRPGKVVSDALRWDVRRGRVLRHGRGLYGPGAIPRQTKSRILHRVARMRAQVAEQRHLAA